jgi:hypothetical protein
MNGAEEKIPRRLQLCVAIVCGYCNRACQKNHWKKHKAHCSSVVLTKAEFLDNSHPEVVFETSEKRGSNTECSICLSDTIVNPVIVQACQHAFCLECLTNWDRPTSINQMS